MTVAAIVLAGGRAVRLGGADKALLDLGGRTLLDHLLGRLAEQTIDIAISANGDPARFAPYGKHVLPDGEFAGEGPLAGLLAGLEWAAGEAADTVLSVPCDTPFIPHDLVVSLSPAPAAAAANGRVHHLIALWPVAACRELRRWLGVPGRRGVKDFAASLGARAVVFPTATWDPFLNINTPDDLARARRIAAHGKGVGWRRRP